MLSVSSFFSFFLSDEELQSSGPSNSERHSGQALCKALCYIDLAALPAGVPFKAATNPPIGYFERFSYKICPAGGFLQLNGLKHGEQGAGRRQH